jgi:hypothetical protein
VFHIQQNVRLDRLNTSHVNTKNILRTYIYFILSQLRYGLANFGISSTAGKVEKLVCSPKCPDRPWIPPCLLPNGCQRLFFRRQSGLKLKLTTHLHLLPRLRMYGAYTYTHSHAVMAIIGTPVL